MKTFVILLSFLVCCVTAGRLGLTQKLLWLDSVRQGQQAAPLSETPLSTYSDNNKKLFNSLDQGYTSQGTNERQQFLLDVLLQVQKPLVNTQLIVLGQILVTDPNQYVLPNDEILQQFLQQASYQNILGRNDVYNPVDMSDIRQLVGLQRFFVLAQDFTVFQKNVVYARLYFNPVMFVDALSLAIRDRADTQDLVMPSMNEILPQLYYDNYVLNAAQNVDYYNLISQATRTSAKHSLFDVFGLGGFGSLFQVRKYGLFNPRQQRRVEIANGRANSEIQAQITLQVGEQGGASTDLTNDIALNVAFSNIIIDQLAQTVTEVIEGEQHIGGIGSNQQKYQQGQYYQQGEGSNRGIGVGYRVRRDKQDIYEGQTNGESLDILEGINAVSKQNVVNTNELPQVDVNSQHLLRVGRRHRGNTPYGGYSNYVNPLYRQQNQYSYNDQENDYEREQNQGSQYGYNNQAYGSSYAQPNRRQQSQGAQYGSPYGYKDQEYSSYYGSPCVHHQNQGYFYGRGQNQGAQYSYNDQKYGSYYAAQPYGREQSQRAQYGSSYGYKDQEYGSYYGSPYGHQQSQGAQYGYQNQGYSYGPRQNQGAQHGSSYVAQPYGSQQNQEGQYGSLYGYKDQEYGSYYANPYGRQQNQGALYGYQNQGYSYGRGQKQGAQYGYKNQEYGSSYANPFARQQNQGNQYGYKNLEYGSSSSYSSPYGRQQNQEAQYGYRNQEYGYGAKGPEQAQYQRQQQQVYRVQPYGQEDVVSVNDVTADNDDETVVARYARDTGNRGESGRRNRGHDSKRHNYRYTEQYRELESLRGEIVRSIAATQQVRYSRRGEILLQSIQELAARLNMQQIVEIIEGGRSQQQQQQYLQIQQEIGQIMQQLRILIDQVTQEAGISEGSEETLDIVASIINGKIILEQRQLSIATQSSLQELQQQIQRVVGNQVGQVNEVTPLVLLAGNLRNPVTQQTILSLAQLIDEYRQELQPYTKNQLGGNGDIAVRNILIDPLVTYTEVVDADLVNLIDQQLLQSNTNNLQHLSQKVVARQQRLNYEPFTISMNIESELQQDVSIRILLGPQVDYNGRRVSLAQNRQNYIVIDAFVKQLQAGENNIQRYSRQFNGYSNEVSTISEIYRQVITGQKQQQQSGTNSQLPQHLLLPRGTTINGGLPVQIMVVVTPLTQQDRFLLGEGVNAQQISGVGIAGIGVDQLPLGYPLDRQIVDEQSLNVPNILATETVIQYDSRTRA
ncbi:fat-body protein 1-like isoform X1 [Anastrepha obliqua]|uniref:fat-body protein 1-like isoform X1 n=1 Tax=Anastrepha obliqua TaxID=95512 RepID=UPI00240A745A|nr:fat-body protein 1-like isoform X1 [Anastrepha obliqua]